MPPSRTLKRLAAVIVILSFIYILLDRVLLLLSARDPTLSGSKQSAAHDKNSWNLFYHLGGNGPWIPHHSKFGSIHDTLPPTCVVDQVHMMSRHGERYPTRNAGNRHLQLLDRLERHKDKLQGSLSFLREWTYFTDLNAPKFEDLTSSGPYAGTKQAADSGRKLKTLYGHLVEPSVRPRFWSCSSPRDVETARYFAKGFFGEDWETSKLAELEVIPEEANRGADTLTPGDTCLKYISDLEEGHDKGYGKLAAWQATFAAPIAKRLERDVGSMHLGPLDIYSMMEMCGFEILARGSSPWCEVFSHDEWRQFEYGRDLLHFYRAGPGNRFSKVMGWLYLNATAEVLMNTTSTGRDVYLSFVHDGDIVPLMSALKVLDERGEEQELPTGKVEEARRWVTSDVVPMGGRVVFERIACESGKGTRRYVRLSINDGVVEIPGLAGSKEMPHAVNMEDFTAFVASKGEEYGSYMDVCGLPPDAPSRISFLHQ